MRKIIALLIALCLLPAFAIAETSEPQIITYDFGDFTLEFPEDIVGGMNERTDNGLFFQLYPEYNAEAAAHPNLVCGWSEGVYDLTGSDPQITGMAIRDSIVDNYEAQNNTVQTAELVSAEILDMDGKKAFRAELHVIVDLSDQAGQELISEYYQTRIYIADEAFGTYTFTIVSDTQENAAACDALLDTLKWTA